MLSLSYLRHFRLGGFAIFDFAVSFLGIYLLSPLLSRLFLKIGIRIPRNNWLYLTLPLSIVFHLLVNKITPMTKNFLDPHGHYILKIIILGLLFLGLKNIKINKKGVV